MRPAIRPSTPNDASALAQLLSDVLRIPLDHPAIDPRQLHWKYWLQRDESPGARSYVLARGRELLAHAGVIDGLLLATSLPLRTAHVIDWAARPRAIGAGSALLGHVRRFSDALLSIGGSAQTRALLPALGFEPAAPAIGFARPLHPFQRVLRSSRSSWRLPAQFARSAFWTLAAPKRSTEHWSVRPVTDVDIKDAAFPLPVATPPLARMSRSIGMLARTLSCPIAPSALYIVEHEFRPVRGYFLLTQVPAQIRLGDCWVASDAAADWTALLELAIQTAREDRGAAEIVALTSDPAMGRHLTECGFHARTREPVQLLSNSPIPMPKQLLVQLIDNDSLFNHSGKPEFWA